MKILNDLIKSLPEVKVKDAIVGVFDTAVLTERWGMASTLKADPCNLNHGGIADSGNLASLSVKQLAQYSLSENTLDASLGIAAINSAINIDIKSLTEVNAAEMLMHRSIDKDIAIIGHFPFVDKLRNIARKLYVIEKNISDGDYPESMAKEILPSVDVVAITATSLTNHTFESLMKLINPKAFVMMLGPSTPLSKILFDYGIDVISGSLVTDEKLFLKYLLQGASYRQLKGISRVTIMKQNKV